MKRVILIAAVSLCLVPLKALAESVWSGPFELVVNPDGAGFIDEVRLDGKTIGSFDTGAGAQNPGYALSAGAEQATDRLLGIVASEVARGAFTAPCRLWERANPRGHKEVVLENGFLKVVCVLDIGGRIVEVRSKLTGHNFVNDRYSQGELPDLSKRVYLGGWEDAIDRGGEDVLWKMPYQARIDTQTDDEVRVTLHCEAVNPGEGGNRLRVERTLTLRRGSPALEIDLQYTVLGVRQNVKIMPHPEPLAGQAVDDGDVFYVSSQGAVKRAPFAEMQGRDIFYPIDPTLDSWAAVLDLEERVGLVHVYEGPVNLLDVYLGREGYTLEPYTPLIEGVEPGNKVSLRNLYLPCLNLDNVIYADRERVVELLLERDRLGRQDPLRAKVAGISATEKVANLILRPTVHGPGGPEAQLKEVNLELRPLAAAPRVHEWDISQLAGGSYQLVVDILRDGRKLGQARIPFQKQENRGSFCDFFLPADPRDPFSVLGQTLRCVTRVDNVRKQANQVVLTGRYLQAETGSPFTLVFQPGKAEGEFQVRHLTTLQPPVGARLRAVGFNLPLQVANDDTQVYTAVGCENRIEQWRLDHNDEYYWTWLISDERPRWPLWRRGGLLIQTPTRAIVWKAGGIAVSPLVVDEATSSPGWLDFSGPEFGCTVLLDDCAKRPPKQIMADGSARLLTVHLYPPQTPPLILVSGQPEGKTPIDELGIYPGRETVHDFRLHFHRGWRPVPVIPELPDDKYRRLLQAAAKYFPRRLPGIGIPVHRGSVEEQIEKLLRAGISPTDFLRCHASWEMSEIVKALGPNYTYDRNDHEGSVRRIIEQLKQE